MFEVERQEVCHLCRKVRLFAKVPEPHPTRDKEESLEKMQRPPEHELIVTEWIPYGETIPNFTEDNQ